MNTPVPYSVHVQKREYAFQLESANITITPGPFVKPGLLPANVVTADEPYQTYRLNIEFPPIRTPLQHPEVYPDPDQGFTLDGIISLNLYGNGPHCEYLTSRFIEEQNGVLHTGITVPSGDFTMPMTGSINPTHKTADFNIADHHVLRTNPALNSLYDPHYHRFEVHQQLSIRYQSDLIPITPSSDPSEIEPVLQIARAHPVPVFTLDQYPELHPYDPEGGITPLIHPTVQDAITIDTSKLRAIGLFTLKTV